MVYSNNFGQTRVGIRNVVVTQVVNAVDADATAFIAAAGITDLTQAAAISTLVNDLKTYGIWSKMKALYPMVGGTATSHKFNLKDPRDLDAAFRLVFNGGWAHTSTGAKPNGTTGYANTFLIPSLIQSLNSNGLGYYTPSLNSISSTDTAPIGSYTTPSQASTIGFPTSNDLIRGRLNGNLITSTAVTPIGLISMHKTSATITTIYKNSTNVGSGNSGGTLPTYPIFFGTANVYGVAYDLGYSNNEFRTVYISDGLSDTETANFYISIQKFNTTLGRQVGTPYVSDSDAQSFLNAASITDTTQSSAINTLVTDLKTAGIWTKMKAVYPFVGGTATSHKWNLKDPRDLDAAFRLVFNGGWTHTSSGVKPNGSNAYAMTHLSPSSVLTNNNYHLSYYSREQITTGNSVDIGCSDTTGQMISVTHWYQSSNVKGCVMGSYIGNLTVTSSNSNTLGLLIGTRTSASLAKQYMNGVQDGSSVTTLNTYNLLSRNLVIGGNFAFGGVTEFTTRQSAFTSIGDGLTDNEALLFNTAVQKFQTTLGRQVNTPLVSDGDAQSFLTAAGITSYTQANAVNTLVVDLKAGGLWTKIKALYPMVGGTSTTHKWNLKDPRDTNDAYRLSFSGGWTHGSTGAKPNGTNAYADTFVVPKNVFNSTTFEHVGYYSRTNTSLTTPPYRYDLGVDNYDAGGNYTGGVSMIIRRDTNVTLYASDYGTLATYRIASTTTSDSLGFFLGSQTGTNIKLYKNNSILATNTGISNASYNTLSSSSTRSIWIGTMNELNYTTQNRWTDKETGLISIGEGLNDSEASLLYTAVQKFNTSLGRQVGTPVYNNSLVLNLDAGNANSYPGTGTTWFDLTSGNNGTLVNSPTFNSNLFTFNGSNQYINFGNIQPLGYDSATLVAWIKTTSNQDYAGIVGKAFYGDKLGRFSLHTRSGGKLGIITQGLLNGSPSNIEVTSTQNINTGNWVFVVGVIDRSYGNKLYINGVLDGVSTRNTTSDNWITTDNFTIGFYNGNAGGYFNGSISNVLMYRKVLSDSEIINLYNSTRGRFGL